MAFYWAIGIVAIFVIGIFIYFIVPYSPLRTEFLQLMKKQNSSQAIADQFFDKLIHRNVDFILNTKSLKICCLQYNSGIKPERIARIETKLGFIPFEGLDVYQDGIGSMKGTLAKSIVLFNQTGDAMNQSSLVNCLAESLFVPSLALLDFITWEFITKDQVKGTLACHGLTVQGVFTFDKDGFLLTFTTNDRLYVDTNGYVQQVPWSAICGNYRELDGIMQPKSIKAIWHLPDGDLEYFVGHDTTIEYNVTD